MAAMENLMSNDNDSRVVVSRVAVTGGRDFRDRQFVYDTLDLVSWFLKSRGTTKFEIIHGEAKGVDAFARQWAVDNGITHIPFPARWQDHGRSAGPIRNREMLMSGVSWLIAFPGGRGTANAVKTAESLGIIVYQVGLSIDGKPEVVGIKKGD